MCGHLLLDIHTPFGCLVEIGDGFCECGPPALDALPLHIRTRSR